MIDLCHERFYCNNTNSDVQELTDVFCERAGFHPNIHFECEFPSFIGEATSLGTAYPSSQSVGTSAPYKGRIGDPGKRISPSGL